MTRTYSTAYATERRMFFLAFSIFFILCGMYIYLLSAAVVHVIACKEIDHEIAQMQSRIGDLESAYISVTQSIATDTLAKYGFVTQPRPKIYVRKASANLVLVTHNED